MESISIASGPRADRELAAMLILESWCDRAVGPGLDVIREKRLVLPDQVPRLRVVDELLQLHRGHASALLQDVCRNIVRRCHLTLPDRPWCRVFGLATTVYALKRLVQRSDA